MGLHVASFYVLIIPTSIWHSKGSVVRKRLKKEKDGEGDGLYENGVKTPGSLPR